MPCPHSLHIPTADSLLASHRSSTGVVFHGVYPTHHDRHTVPFDRGRLFRIPYAQTSLIHDRQVARLYYDNIYRLHGLPKAIISDRDAKFTGDFWSTMQKLFGTDLLMSTRITLRRMDKRS